MTVEARWRLAFLAYVLVQMVARVFTGPALELDEAEAFVHGQHLAWGYGPQPPLYFWLQWAFFQVLGDTILALAALKAVLLGGTLVLTFELMRRAVEIRAAGVATLSLSLLPQIVWESQRALTNSVLALVFAVATALLFVTVLERGRRRGYLAWGAVVALGILGKVSVAVWAAGLLLAAMLVPRWRARLRASGLLLTALAAATVLAGPLVWMAVNHDLAMGSADKFGLAQSDLRARVAGTGSLILATLSFNALALLALGAAFFLGRRPGVAVSTPSVPGLLALAVALSLLVVWLGVLGSGATSIKDRWLLPFAWPLAPIAVAAMWPALTERARGMLLRVTAALWVIAALLLPYASLVDPGYRGADWSVLAVALREEGAPGITVETTSTLAAGNLALLGEPVSGYLPRPQGLSSDALLLVVPGDSGLPDAAWIVDRTRGMREVMVPRGRRPMPFLVLELSPA